MDRGVEAEPSRFNRWEIVKSIVYGGLSESITSLGIMTSAASANTAIGYILLLFSILLIASKLHLYKKHELELYHIYRIAFFKHLWIFKRC